MIMIVAVVYVIDVFFGNVDDDRQAGQTQSCALLFTILPPPLSWTLFLYFNKFWLSMKKIANSVSFETF